MEHAPSSVPGDSCSECALCLIASAYEPSAPHPAHARPAAGRSLALGPEARFLWPARAILAVHCKRVSPSELPRRSHPHAGRPGDVGQVRRTSRRHWQARRPRGRSILSSTPGMSDSTLVSRLLENAPGVLALREPLALRALAEAQDTLGAPESLVSPEQFASFVREQIILWSRGYADTRAVIVEGDEHRRPTRPGVVAGAASGAGPLPQPSSRALSGGATVGRELADRPSRVRRRTRAEAKAAWR